MTTASLLALAMVLDAVFGEPDWLWSRLPHPAVLLGRLVSLLDRAFNSGTGRFLRGVLALMILAALAIFLGHILSYAGPVAEIVIAAILIAQKSLVQHVSAVADAMGKSLKHARETVAMIVSRDTRDMTEPQIARSAIESAAENLSDGVIAPAFWFLIFGLPGLFLYKAVNTADSMIGYRNERYLEFGWASARFDDLLNLVPARLTGVLIALLSGQIGSWSAIAEDARMHKSPNAGWPEAAMARALNVALAGPRSYDGKMRDLAWVNGTARRDIGKSDIYGAVSMLWRVWLTALVLVIAIAICMQFFSA